MRLYDERGIVTIRRPAPHVELIRCEGYARAAYIDMVLESRDLIVREQGKIAIFDDLAEMRGYDSDVRARLTEWSRRHRNQIVDFHILVRSKIVAMGVSLANLAIGGHIQAHTSRTEFDAALARAIRQR